jgi:hypothetical protein
MILFEANAVGPLVKLPDVAMEERVQLEIVLGSGGSGFLEAATGRCGKGAAREANRVYNAGNLLQGPNYY